MDAPDLNSPFAWPSPDDDLFGGRSSNWRAVAYTEGDWGANPSMYAAGYRDAAEILVSQVTATGHHADSLVYPIMFLYRQYIELRLKHIAVAAARLVDDDLPSEGVLLSHDLERLWAHCRAALEKDGGGPASDLENAERTLKQLIWADRGSYAFRYATDKKGNRSLPPELRGIDLGHIREVMSGVSNLLEGITDHLDYQQELKDEWAQEMASWQP